MRSTSQVAAVVTPEGNWVFPRLGRTPAGPSWKHILGIPRRVTLPEFPAHGPVWPVTTLTCCEESAFLARTSARWGWSSPFLQESSLPRALPLEHQHSSMLYRHQPQGDLSHKTRKWLLARGQHMSVRWNQ